MKNVLNIAKDSEANDDELGILDDESEYQDVESEIQEDDSDLQDAESGFQEDESEFQDAESGLQEDESEFQGDDSETQDDWYAVIVASQPDYVELKRKERNRFNEAFEFYRDGSYNRAYQDFLALSEMGSCNCQYFLGLMYTQGTGALQDYCRAHMWFNIASSQGHKKARLHLEKLARRMSSEQIAEAQRLAREWVDNSDLSWIG